MRGAVQCRRAAMLNDGTDEALVEVQCGTRGKVGAQVRLLLPPTATAHAC